MLEKALIGICHHHQVTVPADIKLPTRFFVLEREANEMSKDEWRELIAGIPDDVEK